MPPKRISNNKTSPPLVKQQAQKNIVKQIPMELEDAMEDSGNEVPPQFKAIQANRHHSIPTENEMSALPANSQPEKYVNYANKKKIDPDECEHTNELLAIVASEESANYGKEYYKCEDCKKFLRWGKGVKPARNNYTKNRYTDPEIVEKISNVHNLLLDLTEISKSIQHNSKWILQLCTNLNTYLDDSANQIEKTEESNKSNEQ